MTIEPIAITDKLGRTVELRTARLEDAEDLIQYLKVTCGETPYLIREPDEVVITLEDEKNILKSKIESDRELMLVAYIGGEHIGNCSLMSLTSYRKYQHRCEVAIAIYQKYWGCGIGKAMLETVIDVATKIGYEQAELEVIAGNDSAISLYEKLGFKKYGTFPNSMKYSDGLYSDAYWMMKKLV